MVVVVLSVVVSVEVGVIGTVVPPPRSIASAFSVVMTISFPWITTVLKLPGVGGSTVDSDDDEGGGGGEGDGEEVVAVVAIALSAVAASPCRIVAGAIMLVEEDDDDEEEEVSVAVVLFVDAVVLVVVDLGCSESLEMSMYCMIPAKNSLPRRIRKIVRPGMASRLLGLCGRYLVTRRKSPRDVLIVNIDGCDAST